MNDSMTIPPPLDPQFTNVAKTAFPRQMDFWDGFKPVYYFSRAFGLLPFSIRRNSNGDIQEPKVNRLDGLWFLLTIVVFLSASYFVHQYISAFNSKTGTYVAIILDDLHVVSSLAFGALMIAMDMCNRLKIVELWKHFISFDKEVSTFEERKYKSIAIFFIHKSTGVGNGNQALLQVRQSARLDMLHDYHIDHHTFRHIYIHLFIAK